MNIPSLIASIVLLGAAGGAVAAPATTREQVVAELARARTAGELDVIGDDYPAFPRAAPSTLTRAQVHAELLRARAAGEIASTEDGYPVTLPAAPSDLSRQAVRAEAVRARAAGELDCSETTLAPAMDRHASN